MDTGETITGIEYLRQSVWRILSTPLGTRVMRPEFGSRLPDLVDYPFNNSTRLAMEAATSDALARWEPTFDIDEVEVEMINVGVVSITLIGSFLGQPTRLDRIEIGRTSTSETPVVIPTVPDVPVNPPVTPTGDDRWTTFIFGNDEVFIFGNDETFGWDQ